jgi:hypothetical protein
MVTNVPQASVVLVLPATNDVVVTVVVVVVPAAHCCPAHASQQLDTTPAHAVPPFGFVHRAADFLIAHDVFPCRSVRQHATAPGFPHVERAAHRTTAPLQSFGSVPAFTAAFAWWATHET